jgi:hypothetical protein
MVQFMTLARSSLMLLSAFLTHSFSMALSVLVIHSDEMVPSHTVARLSLLELSSFLTRSIVMVLSKVVARS